MRGLETRRDPEMNMIIVSLLAIVGQRWKEREGKGSV